MPEPSHYFKASGYGGVRWCSSRSASDSLDHQFA